MMSSHTFDASSPSNVNPTPGAAPPVPSEVMSGSRPRRPPSEREGIEQRAWLRGATVGPGRRGGRGGHVGGRERGRWSPSPAPASPPTAASPTSGAATGCGPRNPEAEKASTIDHYLSSTRGAAAGLADAGSVAGLGRRAQRRPPRPGRPGAPGPARHPGHPEHRRPPPPGRHGTRAAGRGARLHAGRDVRRLRRPGRHGGAPWPGCEAGEPDPPCRSLRRHPQVHHHPVRRVPRRGRRRSPPRPPPSAATWCWPWARR